MTTWSEARQAIFDALVLASELPEKHFEWKDGPQTYNAEPQFTIQIFSSISAHERRIFDPTPAPPAIATDYVVGLSLLTEIVVTVECQSIATTAKGKPLNAEPGRRLALDALEHMRMGVWRPQIVDTLRAKKLVWYDDNGIKNVSYTSDDRTISRYVVDLKWRGEIFYSPRDPNIGTIEHFHGEGDYSDPTVESDLVADRPPDPPPGP